MFKPQDRNKFFPKNHKYLTVKKLPSKPGPLHSSNTNVNLIYLKYYLNFETNRFLVSLTGSLLIEP
jgi:hypothetical protein